MSEQQSVVVRLPGEWLRTLSDNQGTYTLYRTPEGLYRVHVDQARGEAFLEPAPGEEGYDLGRARIVAPELFREFRA